MQQTDILPIMPDTCKVPFALLTYSRRYTPVTKEITDSQIDYLLACISVAVIWMGCILCASTNRRVFVNNRVPQMVLVSYLPSFFFFMILFLVL